MASEACVVIVGGGVIGCAIGLELQKRGFEVTVIDKNGEVGHGSTSAADRAASSAASIRSRR